MAAETSPPLYALAARLMPGWRGLSNLQRAGAVTQWIGLLPALVFAVVGITWLIAATEARLLLDNAPLLVALAAFAALLDLQLDFTVSLSRQDARPVASGSLGPVVIGAAMFLFGPSGLWAGFPSLMIAFARDMRTVRAPLPLLERVRNLAQEIGTASFAPLAGLLAYRALGGTFPLADLEASTILAAFAAVAVEFAIALVILFPYVLGVVRYLAPAMAIAQPWQIVTGLLRVIALGRVIELFGVIGSALYASFGPAAFALGSLAVLMGAVIAHRLSRAVALSTQRERSLARLEALGRAIIAAPADLAALADVVSREGRDVFATARCEVMLFPKHLLLREPDDDQWPRVPDSIWRQLRESRAHVFAPGLTVKDDAATPRDALAVPIINVDDGSVIGGIYVMRARQRGPVADLLPTAQVFAEQIASAVLRARASEQQQAKLMAERELAVAGEIQRRFLPKHLPAVPGYQLVAHLDPARQASGDFYDVASLPNGMISLTIADVADKGTGAALFMALSCTLIRTYAPQHPRQPEAALREVNRRICEDAGTDLFVTMLHGMLDSANGDFYYCNAGHMPGLLLRQSGEWVELPNGGMPLGIFVDTVLQGGCVTLQPGDVLVLYTDGITDAQDASGDLFGDVRLRDCIRAYAALDAVGMQKALLFDALAHARGAPQFDDITLIVVKRVE